MSPRHNAEKLFNFYQNMAYKFGNKTNSAIDFFDHLNIDSQYFQQFLAGFSQYLQMPYNPRKDDTLPILWQSGSTVLRQYAQAYNISKPPIIFVPSLINRGYIFDLFANNSLFSFLNKCGFQPWLVDWGIPDEDECNFSLNDYAYQRLVPLLQAASKLSPYPPVVVGYCMGGLLALQALAQYHNIKGLALFAVPINLQAYQRSMSSYKSWIPALNSQPSLQSNPPIAHHWQQLYFHSLNFAGVMKKFQQFFNNSFGPNRLQQFITVEDWLNDGIPLASKVMWQLIGVNDYNIASFLSSSPHHLPTAQFAVIPAHDKIVPTSSAEALFDYFTPAHVLRPELGHIGIIISSRAKDLVWKPFADWLKTLY